jgi:hypothetical protein
MARLPQRMVLTHFGPVRDLDRLSGDLHADIDEFVRIAMRNRAATDRAARIANEMFEHLDSRLTAHGYEGDEATRHALLDPDVDLNTQGLEVWLARA